MNDAERVSGLADDAGQTALYSVVDNRETLDVLANGHARALWMFLNEPIPFRQAEEVRYTDEKRRGRSWDGFIAPRKVKKLVRPGTSRSPMSGRSFGSHLLDRSGRPPCTSRIHEYTLATHWVLPPFQFFDPTGPSCNQP